jgi:hypothetical protein
MRKSTAALACSSVPTKPAMAVRKIRNGKIENSVRKAMFPASGTASSANSRFKLSARSRITFTFAISSAAM